MVHFATKELNKRRKATRSPIGIIYLSTPSLSFYTAYLPVLQSTTNVRTDYRPSIQVSRGNSSSSNQQTASDAVEWRCKCRQLIIKSSICPKIVFEYRMNSTPFYKVFINYLLKLIVASTGKDSTKIKHLLKMKLTLITIAHLWNVANYGAAVG